MENELTVSLTPTSKKSASENLIKVKEIYSLQNEKGMPRSDGLYPLKRSPTFHDLSEFYSKSSLSTVQHHND